MSPLPGRRSLLKPIIVTKLQYVGTSRAEVEKLKGMAKYFQYRDGSVRRDRFTQAARQDPDNPFKYPAGVSDDIRPAHREAKWVDRGMGESWRTITRRAQLTAGSRTTARMWVISPDPALMAHVPEEERFTILRNVTESAVEAWYDDNGWGRPEYSYVLHDKHIADPRSVEFGEDKLQGKSPHQRRLPMVHAHVITPGTYDAGGWSGRLDHLVSRHHIANLHDVTHEKMLGELERVLGRERVQQILAARSDRLLDEKYPGFHERRQKRELHGRLAGMQTAADVSVMMRREKERKERKRKSRDQKKRERGEDLRIYTHYRQRLAYREREASYASLQTQWEARRRHWQRDHRSHLELDRIDDQLRQRRQAQAHRIEAVKERVAEQYGRIRARQVGTDIAGWEDAFADDLVPPPSGMEALDPGPNLDGPERDLEP